MFKITDAQADRLNVNALKPIYELALERFEEKATESESITDKGSNLLIAMITAGAFLSGWAVQHKLATTLILFFITLYIVEIVLLFVVIAPRVVYFRGLKPETAYPENLDAEPDDKQEAIVYQGLINTVAIKINDFDTILRPRILKYKIALIWACVLLIGTAIVIGSSIS